MRFAGISSAFDEVCDAATPAEARPAGELHPPAPPKPNPAGFAEAKFVAPRLNGMLDEVCDAAAPKAIEGATGKAGKLDGVPKGDDGG